MKEIRQKRKVINPFKVFMMTEYFIVAYVIAATITNLLNIAGIIHFDSWFMKPTFFGSSLLSLMLLQYGLIRINRENITLSKIRPHIMALIMADIVSLCSLPLCLMLLLVTGYFLITGFQKKYRIRNAALTVLLACAGLEIYSIFMLDGEKIENSIGNFLKSIGLDILFIIAAFLYSIVLHKTRTTDKKHMFQALAEWTYTKARRIACCTGGVICIISMGLFLYYLVTIGIGVQKISTNTEKVFVLKQSEDDTLALTVLEDEETQTYNISLEKYMGTNNQKVYLQNLEGDTWQFIFLDPEYILDSDAQISYATLVFDSLNQWQHIDTYNFDGESLIIEKTTSDEFITRTLNKYRDEFKPTILMETVITLIGGWVSVLFIVIVLIAFTIIYARRIIGDKLAALYTILFAYMLAYGAVSSMVLLMLTLGVQCYGAYLWKTGIRKI